jgi:hypothetical protein
MWAGHIARCADDRTGGGWENQCVLNVGVTAAYPLYAGFSLRRCSPPLSADLQQPSPGLFANGTVKPPRWHIFADQPPVSPLTPPPVARRRHPLKQGLK